MAIPYRLGKDGHLYIGDFIELGTDPTPVEGDITSALTTAIEVTNAQDVTGNLQKDVIEISSRANGGYKQKVGTLIDASLTFTALWKPDDEAFDMLQEAFLTNIEIFAAALDFDKATAGTQGLSGNFTVVNFSRGEPLNGAMTVDVELTTSSGTLWYKKTS